MSNTSSKNSLFDMAFEQAVKNSFEDELAAIPPREELEKMYCFSERHKKRMENILRGNVKRDTFSNILRFCQAAAACLAVVVIISSGLLMTDTNVRAAVKETVVLWFDKFTKFTDGNGATYIELTEVAWRPTYLPEGYDVIAESTSGGIATSIYADSDGNDITLIYMGAQGSSSVNNEGVVFAEKEMGGITYHLVISIEGGKSNAVIWENEGLRFRLTSEIGIPELWKVALSITKNQS